MADDARVRASVDGRMEADVTVNVVRGHRGIDRALVMTLTDGKAEAEGECENERDQDERNDSGRAGAGLEEDEERRGRRGRAIENGVVVETGRWLLERLKGAGIKLLTMVGLIATWGDENYGAQKRETRRKERR